MSVNPFTSNIYIPLNPFTTNITKSLYPFTSNINIPLNPFTSNITRPLNPFTSNITMSLNPFTSNITMPLNPFTSYITMSVNPFTSNITMSVNPFTSNIHMPLNPFTINITKSLYPFTSNIHIPLNPFTSNITMSLNPFTSNITMSLNPFTSNITMSLNPFTSNITMSLNPFTSNITMSLNPFTSNITMSVNPFTSNITMSVNPFTSNTTMPLNPFTSNTTMPLNPFTSNIHMPLNPFTSNIHMPLNPFTSNIHMPLNPFTSNIHMPLNPFTSNIHMPLNPFTSNIHIPLNPFTSNITMPLNPFTNNHFCVKSEMSLSDKKQYRKAIFLRLCKRRILLALVCLMIGSFFLFNYASNSAVQSFSMEANSESDQQMDKSSSLLDNTELIKVIASSGLITKLSTAITKLDPNMANKNQILKALKKMDIYSILKTSLEGGSDDLKSSKIKTDIEGKSYPESNSNILSKPTVKSKVKTEVIPQDLNPVAKPQEETTYKPRAELTSQSLIDPNVKSHIEPTTSPQIIPTTTTPQETTVKVTTISIIKEKDITKPTCQGLQKQSMDQIFRVNETQCYKVFSDDREAIDQALNHVKNNPREMLSNYYYINTTANCSSFQLSRGYITCKLTQEEEDFPIAFSLITFKDIEMVERLLRAVYRPQNYYCIHVDKKADEGFTSAISSIANCFDNVFIAPERVDVKWGEYSVLEPELICMEHLWKFKKWKYFINLTGQEFPLKTNWELVQILKAYNGANDLEGTVKRANQGRWKSSPPHNLRATKGSVHITANREFVDFILHNQTSKDLLEWVKTTDVPDEAFFATLNHNPQLGIKGTYKGEPETESVESMGKPFLSRFKNWGGDPFNYPCAGQFVRSICILSTGDLPQLWRARQLFANKFYLWEDPIAIGCLEEMIYNNTRDELSGVKVFNSTYYSQLGFVLNQVT
ncbi:beta-1 3-galactosyl-O-glycosyl-glycoprotein beta-1 6-N-acetylglucosaminyltransferase [Biomphalaria pfeifferi]|uniref:Beta-1 3-galactosyl-O-glycosyl-glycoprotein beta-1 6-N-acetylglucosaminyltransferase n=1 Tax=Biomphalaria pfeifferi TaxID=112525 RepID=A0AAD8FM20_BIOPF|nr:beta-1 3-galactosyl-O-glycosyl-glycoprotein beta-1 6-N-acetylglucosaminyltransferase [Biomphalaria pfeifferi]